MKYIKMLGLAAIAAAALMAVVGAGTASATTLTDGSGNHPTFIAATSTHTNLHNSAINVTCTHSVAEGHPSTGGTGLTVEGPLTYLDFTNCGSWTVTVKKAGKLIVHGSGGNHGTLTSEGAEVTLSGFGLHCIFTTNTPTDIGTLTGSAVTKGHAVLDIAGTIARTGGNSGAFCGSSAQWTGSYTVTSPSVLNIHE